MTKRSTPDAEHLLWHASYVRAVARAVLGGDDLLDDVVQETWVAALEGGAGRRGRLAPWLAGVARNQARNLLRRRAARRRREHVASRPEGVRPEQEVVERLEIERQLIEAVGELSESCRTPLVLRYLDDLPPRVIAVRLDLPVETVRTRIRRGLAELRRRLEAQHGKEARDWRLALLPLAAPTRGAVPSVGVAAGGGLMAKKVLVVALALVLLGGGVVFLGHEISRPPEPVTKEGREVSQRTDEASGTRPALTGRPREHEAGPAPTPREDPPAVETAPVAVAAAEVRDAMTDLIADIRREVEPAWWGEYPTLGTLEGRNGIVIARATRDVLDGIERYLDGRRRGGAVEEPELVQPDPRAADAARAALRPVLVGMLERETKLEAALAAWRDGKPSTVRTLAAEVLAEEPENAIAAAFRDADAPDAVDRAGAALDDLRRQPSLSTWALQWPSASAWGAISRALADAGESLGGLAPELSEQLIRGSVSVELRDARLTQAVRRLQIASFADIRLNARLTREADQLRIPRLQAEGRSLGWILDELVRVLPEGWTWYAARQQIVLTKQDADGAPQLDTFLRYFDVKDLVIPGYPQLRVETAPGTPPAPPTPPMYRRNADGVVVPAELPGTNGQGAER